VRKTKQQNIKNSVSDEVVGVGGKLAYIRAYYALL